MEADAILAVLNARGPFPFEAVKAARERRVELTPRLVASLAAYADGAADEDHQLVFFAAHLLAEWRVREAYAPLLRLVRASEDRLEAAFDGAITETLPRILAGVFDGDPAPLFDLIANADADQFVRWGACDALAMLAAAGELDRAVAMGFLREVYEALLREPQEPVWCGWLSAVGKLGLDDLRPLALAAFERGMIDPLSIGLEDFEGDLADGVGDDPQWRRERRHRPLDDIAHELAGWYCFSDDYLNPKPRPIRYGAAALTARARPKVGRNETCPCGSGRKFKKCCLAPAGASAPRLPML